MRRRTIQRIWRDGINEQPPAKLYALWLARNGLTATEHAELAGVNRHNAWSVLNGSTGAWRPSLAARLEEETGIPAAHMRRFWEAKKEVSNEQANQDEA